MSQASNSPQPPTARPDISVAVPTYNRVENLRRLMDGLAQQDVLAEHMEVIVVDDGSSDGTAAYLASLNTAYRLRVISQANAGPAAARNRALLEASAELVLFLDDDVIPDPGLISAHLAAHRETPGAVVIGPMLPAHGWKRPAWVRWEEEKLQAQYASMAAGEFPCSERQFYTANASLLRETLLTFGGFDVGFKRAEDVELAYRLASHGIQFQFAPHARVVHLPTRPYASWVRTPYQYGRNDVVMNRAKGHESIYWAAEEFHARNRLSQLITRLCVGRTMVARAVLGALGGIAQACNRGATRSLASMALSAVFSIQYWQGVADELGDIALVWKAIERARPEAHSREVAHASR